MQQGFLTIILSLIALALLYANRKFKLDTDAGGYKPSITNKATFPKFYVHALGGFASMTAMMAVGTQSTVAVILLAVFGVGYELSQNTKTSRGFINWYDVLADLTGGCVAFGIEMLRHAVR